MKSPGPIETTDCQVANTNRGLYVKAAQFIASIRGGTGERGVPKAYTDALAKFTDHAPHKSINDVAETWGLDEDDEGTSSVYQEFAM